MKPLHYVYSRLAFIPLFLITAMFPVAAQVADAVTALSDGNNACKRGDLDAAISDFSRAIELDPTNSYAYGARGLAKYAKGNTDGAIEDANKAIELDPKNSGNYTLRGIAVMDKGDIDGAISDLTRGITLDSGNIYAYYNRGRANGEKGQLVEAITDLNRAIELNPTYEGAYFARGFARYALGHSEDALGDFQKCVELQPGHSIYPRLFIWLVQSEKPEQTEENNRELGSYLNANASQVDKWAIQIGKFLTGDLPQAELLRASAASNENVARAQRSEAYFFIRKKIVGKGDDAEVSAFVQEWSNEPDKKDYSEFQVNQYWFGVMK